MRRAADRRRKLEGRLRWYQRKIVDLPKALRELNRLWWRCRDRLERGEGPLGLLQLCEDVDAQYREYRKIDRFDARQLEGIMVWVHRMEKKIAECSKSQGPPASSE
jgi:hypothetical protein